MKKYCRMVFHLSLFCRHLTNKTFYCCTISLSLQTQYAFIHYAILEAITYGDTSFTLSDFSQSYQQLQQKSKETGKTVLEGEYGRLGSVKTMSKASTFVHRVKQKGPTNRSIHYPGHGELTPSVDFKHAASIR